MGLVKKVMGKVKNPKSNLGRRLSNRFIDGPFYFLGGYLGTTMAAGAMTTESEFEGVGALADYGEGAVQGIYEIPKRILQLRDTAETVSAAGNEIIEAGEPAKADLDEIIEGSSQVFDGSFSEKLDGVGRMIDGSSSFVYGTDGAMGPEQGTKDQFMEVLTKHENEVERVAVDNWHEISDMVDIAMNNMGDPLAYVVPFAALAATTTGAYAGTRAAKRKLGFTITSKTEDAIYLGTKFTIGLAANAATAVGIGYALTRDSMYSKFLETKENIEINWETFKASFTELNDAYQEAAKIKAAEYGQRFENSAREAYNSFGEFWDSTLDSAGNALRNMFEGETSGKIADSMTTYEFTPTEIDSLVIQETQVPERTEALSNAADSLKYVIEQAPEALKGKSDWEAFRQFTGDFYNGIGYAVTEGAKFTDGDIAQKLEEVRQLDELPEPVKIGMVDMAVNLGNHLGPAIGMAILGYTTMRMFPLSISMGLNKIHDKYYMNGSESMDSSERMES